MEVSVRHTVRKCGEVGTAELANQQKFLHDYRKLPSSFSRLSITNNNPSRAFSISPFFFPFSEAKRFNLITPLKIPKSWYIHITFSKALLLLPPPLFYIIPFLSRSTSIPFPPSISSLLYLSSLQRLKTGKQESNKSQTIQ